MSTCFHSYSTHKVTLGARMPVRRYLISSVSELQKKSVVAQLCQRIIWSHPECSTGESEEEKSQEAIEAGFR